MDKPKLLHILRIARGLLLQQRAEYDRTLQPEERVLIDHNEADLKMLDEVVNDLQYPPSVDIFAFLVQGERAKQVAKGFTADWDTQNHTKGELAAAASCYALAARVIPYCPPSTPAHQPLRTDEELRERLREICCDNWPFEEDAFRPSLDAMENLVTAAALIGAEADRIIREMPSEPKEEG